jgi:diguanylate cyclase
VALSLFQNFSILVAVISITLEFVRSSKVQYQSVIMRRFVLGTVGGLIGILLLMSTVPINSERTIIFDFRFVVMYLSAMYGGFISSIITSVIIAFYRIAVTGANANAIIVSTSILICGVLLGALSHLKVNRSQKFMIMNTVVTLTIITASYLIFDNFYLFIINSLMFTSTTVITSYFLCRYIHFSIANIRNYWQLKIDATTDHLTELANLREFDNRFDELFEQCQENQMPISFLMLDLDHFKMINDTYGHQAGDEVLSELAQILIKSCRSYDLVARIGGEEFAIVLPRCPKETALSIGRRTRQYIEEYIFCKDTHAIRMTVSIGVSSYPNDANDPDKLMALADEALYKAKSAGRNAVVLAQ